MRLIDAETLKKKIPGTATELLKLIDLEPEAPRMTSIKYFGDWISVKDRLPEERINPLTQDFAEVICFCDFGGEPRRTDVRTYKFGKPTWDKDGHFLHGGQIMDGVITHWQYLPEPPKEEN